MTLRQAMIVFRGWETRPPTHHLAMILAQLWGWKPAAPPSPAAASAPAAAAAAEASNPAAILAVPGFRSGGSAYEGLPKPMTADELAALVRARAQRTP